MAWADILSLFNRTATAAFPFYHFLAVVLGCIDFLKKTDGLAIRPLQL
jgi:hypothetical protein